jgi:cytidylate kinase
MALRVVTIDGPAASGKSTVARLLAQRIGAVFLDTGAMYRAVTWAAMTARVDLTDTDRVLDLVRSTSFGFVPQETGMRVAVQGRDVTDLIRDPEVTARVKFIAAAPRVRDEMVRMQRAFARTADRIVTEGRDQGTVAFPDADVKVFLTADPAERARRRQAELQSKGVQAGLDQVHQAVAERDRSDEDRPVGALKPAADAVIVDTTGLTVDQVVEGLWRLVQDRCGPGGAGRR